MIISSRTPDGWPHSCPICGHSISITPSPNTLDAPCPACGQLLWFTNNDVFPLMEDQYVPNPGITTPYELPGDFEIPDYVIEMVPASVAMENRMIPVDERNDQMVVAVAVPVSYEMVQKLEFILNRRVLVVPTSEGWADRQMDRYYTA